MNHLPPRRPRSSMIPPSSPRPIMKQTSDSPPIAVLRRKLPGPTVSIVAQNPVWAKGTRPFRAVRHVSCPRLKDECRRAQQVFGRSILPYDLRHRPGMRCGGLEQTIDGKVIASRRKVTGLGESRKARRRARCCRGDHGGE